MGSEFMPVQLPNTHLHGMTSDFLFHLGISLDDPVLMSQFSNIKFVCVGGTASRMRSLAQSLSGNIYNTSGNDINNFDYTFENDRYSGYKVGAILCVSHGIGTPSLSIVLHELFKLLQKAKCCDVTLIRIGTCGGLGLPDGTVIISDGALTPGLKPVFRTSCLGEIVELPVTVDETLIKEIHNCHRQETDAFQVVCAKTYCADGFYISQGRLDGAICDYTKKEQQEFLQKLYDLGVRNIEMESAGVLAFAHKVGIKAAVVCVTMVDRLRADLPTCKEDVQNYPLDLITRFIKSKLSS